MEVDFEDDSLRKLLESDKALTRKFGERKAKVLKRRMRQLQAASTVKDLPLLPGRWHELSANRAGLWAGDLIHPERLIIRPSPPIPFTGGGGIDWANVTAIIIVEIVDYH